MLTEVRIEKFVGLVCSNSRFRPMSEWETVQKKVPVAILRSPSWTTTSFIIHNRTWQASSRNGEAVVIAGPLYEWRVTRPQLPRSRMEPRAGRLQQLGRFRQCPLCRAIAARPRTPKRGLFV